MLTVRKDHSVAVQHELGDVADGQAEGSLASESEFHTTNETAAILEADETTEKGEKQPQRAASPHEEALDWNMMPPQSTGHRRNPSEYSGVSLSSDLDSLKLEQHDSSEPDRTGRKGSTFAELKKQFLTPETSAQEDRPLDRRVAEDPLSSIVPGEESLHTRNNKKTVKRYTSEGIEFDAFWRCVSTTQTSTKSY